MKKAQLKATKAIIAGVVLLGTWGATAAADGRYDPVELWGLCGVVGGAWAVYSAENAPKQQ